ncbi:BglG family transcription antiterminator [Streptococcus henryi]|uniref:BglG family transcription antiterminator n=1 Tax=Streptococcus henryi TaxID=439219 RepID=UPI00036D860A|nr:PRD domain-containing protein [Streptococcus henryi]
MLSKKEIRIVQILIEDRERFVTSRELAKLLNCSDRTIRTYYKSLEEKLNSYSGVDIISKQGHGYKFDISDEKSFTVFLKENKIKETATLSPIVNDIDDRYNYLVNKLLFEQNEIYFDDLAEELFVSRSTLSTDFKKIRRKFAPYQLKIESKANRGVYVTGSERDKRRFIMDHFIDSGFINTLHSYVENELLNLSISFEELTIIVLDECREGNLKLSDFVIQNLVIHIALSIRRIKEGFQIAKLSESIVLEEFPEREIAKRILRRVSAITHLDFPCEEIDYITLHLIAKSYGSVSHVSDKLIKKIRLELLQTISQLSPEFEKDFQLVEGLINHLSTTLIRLENKVVLDNPMTAEIMEMYLDMYQLAEQVISLMPTFSHFNLSKDEIAYIALHFMAAKERYKEQNKYNILVICATGYGSAQMLKSRIENELGSLVHIEDVIGYYDITDEKLQNIDFIISSIDLSNLIFSIPVFTVSVFLTEAEIGEIKRSITHLHKSNNVCRVEYEEHKVDEPMFFDDYFNEDSFFVLSTTTKEEVIKQLVLSIAKNENENFPQKMKDLIEQRESMSSIVFSDSIAVPHPIKALGTEHHIAVAIIPDGICWDAVHQEIKFVFLTSMSIYENDGLPQLASSIVELVDDTEMQNQLLHCHSFKEFRELFLKIKER